MTSSTKFGALLAALSFVTLSCSTASIAATDGGDEQPALQEGAVVLPPGPAKDQLLKYYVSPTATMEFSVDARSVSVSDRVIVRFTSVIRSPSGAMNVSHEGIRCDTYEKKVYATGRPDGGWAPAVNSSWRAFAGAGANRYHTVLADDYFCDGQTAAGSAEAIVQRLRRQTPMPRSGSRLP